MNPRVLVLPFAATAALGVSACGGGSTKEAAAKPLTPAQAATQVGIVRTELDRALATYTGGDKAGAANQVATAYLEHFESVERPLGKVDPALKERLEEAIATDIRARMKAGAPAAQVQALVRHTQADLVTAQGKLR